MPIGSKWGSPCAFNNVFNQHVFHYDKIQATKTKKNNEKKAKKQRNE